MTMTYWHIGILAYGHMTPTCEFSYVLCITIIDTIIIHMHTNNAYYYVTPTCEFSSLWHRLAIVTAACVCTCYIGVVSVVIEYNYVYYCDTCYILRGVTAACVCTLEVSY
jgi:hypothetical protein